MSLAIYAAPFNNDNNMNNDNENIINKKKQTHNKTQKKFYKENHDSEKVSNVLQKIHESMNYEEDNNLGDFNPPPPPESSGVQKTIATESMQNRMSESNESSLKTLGKAPQPNYEYENNDLDLNNFNTNYGDEKYANEYYQKFIPNYQPGKNPNNRRYYSTSSTTPIHSLEHSFGGQDVLMQKLNYMISLLEDQQDEKTNNVTEEVVLYSFLGIFIIFIVDSFARAGKYVR